MIDIENDIERKDIPYLINSEKSDFILYVDDFYNAESGIYPIKGLTLKMIIAAVYKYYHDICDGNWTTWGGGDSLDRERVRDIILEDNNLEWGV